MSRGKAHLLVKTKAAVPSPTPLLRVSDILKKAGVQLTEDQIQSIEEQLKEPATEVQPDEASKVGPRALGLVLADTEMEVEDVDALQRSGRGPNVRGNPPRLRPPLPAQSSRLRLSSLLGLQLLRVPSRLPQGPCQA